MAGVIDLYLVYQFLKRLVVPFQETDAYKLGLIDKDGKKLKKAKTDAEKAANGYFDRLVRNLKRLLAKIPGGQSKIATYAAALLLIKEQDERLIMDENYLLEQFQKSFDSVDLAQYNAFEQLSEDMGGAGIANAVGDGSSTQTVPLTWRSRNIKVGPRGNKKNMGSPGVMFVRRANATHNRKARRNEVFDQTFSTSNFKVGK